MQLSIPTFWRGSIPGPSREVLLNLDYISVAVRSISGNTVRVMYGKQVNVEASATLTRAAHDAPLLELEGTNYTNWIDRFNRLERVVFEPTNSPVSLMGNYISLAADGIPRECSIRLDHLILYDQQSTASIGTGIMHMITGCEVPTYGQMNDIVAAVQRAGARVVTF